MFRFLFFLFLLHYSVYYYYDLQNVSLYFLAFAGAAAAAKIYLESLSRVAKQAQQGTCGGTADIGKTLMHKSDFVVQFPIPFATLPTSALLAYNMRHVFPQR